jgi:hypothetical protein
MTRKRHMLVVMLMAIAAIGIAELVVCLALIRFPFRDPCSGTAAYERYNCTPHRDGHRQLPGAQYKRKSHHRVRSGQLPQWVCEYQHRDADRSQW